MALFPGDIVGVSSAFRPTRRARVLAVGFEADENSGEWQPAARIEFLDDGTRRADLLKWLMLVPDPGEPEEGE